MQVLFSQTPVTLDQSQAQLDQYQTVEYNSIYHHIMLESNWSIYIWMHANVFWCSQQIIRYFSCFTKSYSTAVLGCSAWITSSSHHISFWSAEKCRRKLSQKILLCTDLVTPRQGQGQWKWYKMVEVNGAYKQGRYENIWLNRLRVGSNVKVFDTQDGWPAKHESWHRSIWYSHGSKMRFVPLNHYKGSCSSVNIYFL